MNGFLFQNKTTEKVVFILKETRHLIRVQYMNSKQTAWFRKGDFRRLFHKI